MGNPFENFIPEQKDLQKKRDVYEKQAENDAKKVNTFYENLTKIGMKKEDVIFEDALDEDSVRQQRDDYRLVGGKEDLEKMAESVLTLTKKNDKGRNILEGIIDGKKVKIEFNGDKKYEGIFDDEPISEEKAAQIYSEYASIAEKRTTSMQIVHDVKKEISNIQASKPKRYAASEGRAASQSGRYAVSEGRAAI